MEKIAPQISSSWEDRITSFFDSPKPSNLLATLSSFYYPPNEVTIFEQLPELCKNFTKPGVISKELKSGGLLNKIRQQLKDYLDGDLKKRESNMNRLVELCNKFYLNSIKSRESVQVLPILITFSFLHLTVLYEKSSNQLQIYGGWDNSHERELNGKLSDYQRYFVDTYPLWQDWRKDQIIIKTGIEPRKKETIIGVVSDTITGRSASYSSPKVIQLADGTPEKVNPNKFKEVCSKIKDKFYNENNLEFMKIYVHTFNLNKFQQDKWHDLPVAPSSKVATVWYGTFGRDTLFDGEHEAKDCEEEYELTNEVGIIRGININEYNTVNALTFLFKDQDPKDKKIVGNGRVGHLTTVRGLNEEYNHITAVDLYFNNSVICAIQFFFMNGMKTEILGNRAKANAEKISCRPGKSNEFKLTGVKMASSKADKPEDEESVGYIALGFEYVRVKKD